jgi:hypothetical protein
MVGGDTSDRSEGGRWQPTTFLRFEEALDTSMGTARIVTDAGRAYIKAMGNRQGPHQLACEWVATQLAEWIGLTTFEYALMPIDAEIDEIPLFRGGQAASGPAFLTKAASGHPWGGSEEELRHLVNPGDIGRMVVFDTWVANCDRHPPDLTVRRPNYDNVFLEDAAAFDRQNVRLIAMDHSHCFTCGRDLDERVSHIQRIKDERLYGLFPAFVSHVRQEDVEAAVQRPGETDGELVASAVATVPDEWEVGTKARSALVELVVRRAEFVSEAILPRLARACWPDRLFDNRT